MTTLPTFPSGHEIDNDDRAEMVRPLVQQFHDAYYHHPAGEPWATVIADMIADLGHLFDRLADDEMDDRPRGPDEFWVLLERAYAYYEEEREEDPG